MTIPFWKMHGAANDFILVDDRSETFPAADRAWLAGIASRRTGVGCEGVILIQPSDKADFRMRFFNPDGGEVEMCGNGARCVARLACELGIAPATMTIDTVAGMLSADALGETVRLTMTAPEALLMNRTMALQSGPLAYHSVNTGVPHVVVPVDDLDGCDMVALGSAIRYHADMAPAGTNVNVIMATGPSTIRVRTYERGVEAETLACGTGVVASALVARQLGLVTGPVTVIPASGDELTVAVTVTGGLPSGATLLGPAVHVFQGNLEYDS